MGRVIASYGYLAFGRVVALPLGYYYLVNQKFVR